MLADINEARAAQVADAIRAEGGRATALPFDVTSSASVEAMTAAAVEELGRIDVLYHCAVDVRFVNYEDTRLTELEDAVWDRMIQLCLTGAFYLCKHVGRQMLAQQSGSIILSATTDALIGVRRPRLVHGREGRRRLADALVRGRHGAGRRPGQRALPGVRVDGAADGLARRARVAQGDREPAPAAHPRARRTSRRSPCSSRATSRAR